jgi:hypothetical protein
MLISEKYLKCVVGNLNKTLFLGFNRQTERLCVVELNDDNISILPQWEADLIISTNKNTHFFLENGLKYKYYIEYSLKDY